MMTLKLKSVPKTLEILAVIWTLSLWISVAESVGCYECSSLNDTFCPEFMSSDDVSIVPYSDCSNVYEAAYCIKTTGVTGDVDSISCYMCDETTATDFACSDLLFDAPLHNCSDVFDAQYCIKVTGVYGGSLGTRRFCSSRDLGNYCEYIRRPGDPHEYRSCVFTCSSNSCNPAVSTFHSNISPTLTLLLSTVILLIGSFSFKNMLGFYQLL